MGPAQAVKSQCACSLQREKGTLQIRISVGTCFGVVIISDFSSRPLRNLPPTHVGDPHGNLQASPQHADPHGLGAFLKKTIQKVFVDRRVVGWSAGRHVDHPSGWQISPLFLKW